MIHHIWFIMMSVSIAYACVSGKGGAVLQAALEGCEKAVGITVQLGAGYLFFCGLMEMARYVQLHRRLHSLIRPVLKRLMPGVEREDTLGAIAMNLSMNILGLGNAATPTGLEAIRRMDEESVQRPSVRHDMNMLLILNATGLQLLPTTILTIRTAAGSARPNAVLLPVRACTACSTAVGVGLGLLCRRWEEKNG